MPLFCWLVFKAQAVSRWFSILVGSSSLLAAVFKAEASLRVPQASRQPSLFFARKPNLEWSNKHRELDGPERHDLEKIMPNQRSLLTLLTGWLFLQWNVSFRIFPWGGNSKKFRSYKLPFLGRCQLNRCISAFPLWWSLQTPTLPHNPRVHRTHLHIHPCWSVHHHAWFWKGDLS